MNDIDEISGRFATLLKGSKTESEIYDRPLLETCDWLIAPTLGAIVPNWVLAIPRLRALNFRNWQRETGKEPDLILDAVCRHLGVTRTEVVWFEHGPAEQGSLAGCGVDYAHMHILIRPQFSFEAFADRVKSMAKLDWQSIDAIQAYTSLNETGSYLVSGCGDRAIFASNVEASGSQFFRRVVSSLTGQSELWDYRQYPHSDNIATTIASFRVLESAAECDR
jgi:ATP adenylyltransferase